MKKLLYKNPRTGGTIWMVEKNGNKAIRAEFTSAFRGVAWFPYSSEINEDVDFEEIVSTYQDNAPMTRGQNLLMKMYRVVKKEMGEHDKSIQRIRHSFGDWLTPRQVKWRWDPGHPVPQRGR